MNLILLIAAIALVQLCVFGLLWAAGIVQITITWGIEGKEE
jgi:hypothetical protein